MTNSIETDELPDREKAREFYSKYELKDVLGKGISSVVRKCIEKSTGEEYAAKIVEYNSTKERDQTLKEIEIMKLIGTHPHISKEYQTNEKKFISKYFKSIQKLISFFDLQSLFTIHLNLNHLFLLSWNCKHIYFVQFEGFNRLIKCITSILIRCPNGELFDYLTHVVRLSEKKTRVIMKSIVDAVLLLHNMHIVHRDLKV